MAPRFGLALVILGLYSLPAQPAASKLLTIDIAAIGDHGKLVADLQASDFRVTDAGRPQEIAYFRRGGDITPPAQALLRERSNHESPTFPHALVVVLDQLNAQLELTGIQAREIVKALGRTEWQRDLYFYVLTKEGALYPVYGLPDTWVEGAAHRFHASDVLPIFENMQHRERPDDLDVSRSSRGDPHFSLVMKRKQLYTANALQQLATRLGEVPGSKSIVWVGGLGPKVLSQDPTANIRSDWSDSPAPVPIYYVAAGDSATFKVDPRVPAQVALRVDQTIELAMADSERGYRIGYYPPAGNWDGEHHDLRITCTRPHIKVRASAGYTAVRPVDVEDDNRQGVPDLVSVSPFDTSAIRFQMSRFSPSRLDLRVNAADILFQSSGNAFSCSLVVQVFRYRSGEGLESIADPLVMNRKFTADERAAALRDGILIPLAIPASDAAVSYRIVVSDRVTQSFGTLTISDRRNLP